VGAGAAWAVAHAPALAGLADDDDGFEPGRHPVVAALRRRLPGVRIVRTAAVCEALLPSILEQKVTGLEARRSFRTLVRRLGRPHRDPSASPSRRRRRRSPRPPPGSSTAPASSASGPTPSPGR
jgi:hypothetical protein